MNKTFDDKLAERIKEAFKETDIPFNDDHWANLKAQIESPEKLPGYWKSILKIAAVILLVSFSSVYYLVSIRESNPITDSNQSKITTPEPPNLTSDDPQSSSSKEKPIPKNESDEIDSDDIPEEKNHYAEEGNKVKEFQESLFALYNRNIPSVLINKNSHDIQETDLIKAHPTSPLTIVRAADLPKDQKPVISILASSNFSFSEAENETPLGVSTGITTNIPLHGRMRLSSGLIFDHQNLKVEDTGNEITIESSLNEARQFTQAKLLTLDIPVNVQYDFNYSHKSRTFISMGFSSYFYLKQEFISTTRQVIQSVIERKDGTTIISRNINEQKSATSKPIFSVIDLAQILNLSVGFQRSLNQHSDLIIEPFFKYPIAPITSKDVQFSTGGLRLHIVF